MKRNRASRTRTRLLKEEVVHNDEEEDGEPQTGTQVKMATIFPSSPFPRKPARCVRFGVVRLFFFICELRWRKDTT